jgi:hypothetical protein
MKKKLTQLTIAFITIMSLNSNAQTVSFDTFTLSPNSYYQNNAGTDFSSLGATFQYDWQGYWSSGSAYTNINDTVNGTYTNLYGNITGTAFGGNNYATVQSGAVVSFSNNTTAVNGFYITNTTYAWKIIKQGNQFSRRFGDTTGTGSGTSIPQGEYPDWFKVIVRGYRGGNMIADSIEYYLADYRNSGTTNDFVIKNWQYVNCISLGQVDSISFDMKSSDNSFGFMNTPAFFSMDNFTIQSTVGIEELSNTSNISLFPNPTTGNLFLNIEASTQHTLNIHIYDIAGKELQNGEVQTSIGTNQFQLNTENFEAGIYFVELNDKNSSKKIKFIKL